MFCDVLEVLKKFGRYALLEISDLKELSNSKTSAGKLASTIIEKPND